MKAKTKKILILGASGDIGLEIASQLHLQGHELALHYFEDVKRIQKKFPSAILLQANLAQSEDVKNIFSQLKKKWKNLDALICVSGFPINKKNKSYWSSNFLNTHRQMYRDVFEVDVLGTLQCIQEAYPLLIKSKISKIICFASASALYGHEEGYPYNLAKASLLPLVKSLALEWAAKGVRVNCVSPCSIDTHWLKEFPTHLKSKLENKIPLGRLGRADEVASLLTYLISDQADWMTGQNFLMDGGEMLK